MSRRGFVAGVGAGVAATVAAGAAGAKGVAWAEEASASDGFDRECGVLVIGYGFAGANAAVHAANAGADVLLVDAAPRGEEGGNSRFCAQIAMSGTDCDGLRLYLDSLGWKMDQDAEVLDVYAEGLMQMADLFRVMGSEEPCVWSVENLDPNHSLTPEYSDLPGGESCDAVTTHADIFDGAMYATVQETVESHEGIELWLESPAVRLVQDGDTGEVLGAVVSHEGSEVRVRATGGVVLACGGFECNKQMIQDYLGCPRIAPMGGLYNNGDGIKMARPWAPTCGTCTTTRAWACAAATCTR